MEAFKWIEQNIPPGSIFNNLAGHSGLWIPAIAFRPISNPHNNPFYFDEVKEGFKNCTPKYLYVKLPKVYQGSFKKLKKYMEKKYKGKMVYANRHVIIMDVE